MPYSKRCHRAQDLLIREECEALLVTDRANRYYLSGFTGSSGYLLLTTDRVYLLTDFRYIAQANQQTNCCEVINQGKYWYETLKQLLTRHQVKRLAFEQDHLSYNHYLKLAETVDQCELIGKQHLIEILRETKDPQELELIKKAASIADKAFSQLLEVLKPGRTELEVAADLEYYMRSLGSEGPAFDTIVASGTRSALPHGIAGEKKLELGDLVVIDFGATYQGYRSDMTRTVIIGSATAKQRDLYQLVLKAQLAGLQGIKAGQLCHQVDSIARNIIAEHGYGAYFGHSLGHGVGLNIHENPRLAEGNQLPLEKGMVVTVEPGVYLEDWGGIRIEDMVAVTEDGCEIFTKTSKELIEI